MAIVEKELKLLLKNDSYKKILKNVEQCPVPIRQTNYYFDTPDFKLDKAGITLRIRNEDERWLLCLKIKTNCESRYASSIEIEEPISEEDFQNYEVKPGQIFERISEKQVDLNNIVGSSEISLLGSIKNERLKLNFFSDYILELDHSFFPGGNESFELEIEGVNSEMECDYLIGELKGMGLDFYLNTKSKYKRFVEYIKAN